jgi:hypothetical protein
VLACREAPAPARNGEPRSSEPRRERRNALAAAEKDMAEGEPGAGANGDGGGGGEVGRAFGSA